VQDGNAPALSDFGIESKLDSPARVWAHHPVGVPTMKTKILAAVVEGHPALLRRAALAGAVRW
jgi:hypothetical protein